MNSTFDGNVATGPLGGGAINVDGGVMSVIDSTVARNSTTIGGAAGISVVNDIDLTARVSIYGTIVALNDGGPDLENDGGFLDGASSLIGDGSGDLPASKHNLLGTDSHPLDPHLGTLGDYGGPTQTIPLLAGSPAIVAGAPFNGADHQPTRVDQRGANRGAHPDIGAFQSVIARPRPVITVNPSANPLTVTGTTALLKVQAAENGSGAGLTYHWGVAGTVPVTFSANGTALARTTTATFSQGGTYVLQVTVSDGRSFSTLGSVTVTVVPTLHRIAVTPSSFTLLPGFTQQFSAITLDQFGQPLENQPQSFIWKVASGEIGGNITTAGLYTAPTKAGTDTIIASADGISGSTTVADSGQPLALNVNTFADPATTSSGKLSLRQALAQVNAHPGTYVINLPAGTYKLDATQGPLIVSDGGLGRSITLQGVGGKAIIDAQGKSLVLSVPLGTTALVKNLILTGGDAGSAAGAAGQDIGGGIADFGTLTAVDCSFDSNQAYRGAGLAVINDAIATVIHCTFTNNHADESGGAILAEQGSTLTVSNSTFDTNAADGLGGAIIAGSDFHGVGGVLTVTASTFTDNHSPDAGAIFSAAVATVDHCTFTANSSDGFLDGGGAINNDAGALTVTASRFDQNTTNGTGGAIYTAAGGATSISDTSFTQNSGLASGAIGASGPLAVARCTFTENSANDGGVISSDVSLKLADSTFTNNDGGVHGGALFTGGDTLISGSTFSGNSAIDGGAMECGDLTTVINSTFTQNVADDSEGAGGAINNIGQLSLIDCTVVANTAFQGGGINSGGFMTTGTASLLGSIIAANSGGDLFAQPGSSYTGSYDIVGDGSGKLTAKNKNLLGAKSHPLNPKLSSLANHGGPTQTLVPLPGSPAHANSSIFKDPTGADILTDQRGHSRGAHPDIGAAQGG